MTITKVGDIIRFIARNKYDLCGRNDVGGTDAAPAGTYRIRIDRIWFDYETGFRAVGTLVDPAEVKLMFEVGHTEYGPKLEQWNPATVYFEIEDAFSTAASNRMKRSGAAKGAN